VEKSEDLVAVDNSCRIHFLEITYAVFYRIVREQRDFITTKKLLVEEVVFLFFDSNIYSIPQNSYKSSIVHLLLFITRFVTIPLLTTHRTYTHMTKSNIFIAGLLIIAVLISVTTSFKATRLNLKNANLEQKVTELETSLKVSQEEFARVSGEKDRLNAALSEVSQKNKAFADQLDKISLTLESYDQLSRIDEQLLQKYSKVYFLNENYIPTAVTAIDTKYLANRDKPVEVHDRVWLFLTNMLDAAAADGVDITVVSGYRSFGTQATLKSNYKVTYGSGAYAFSADQGYSEHQLGTTVDFSTRPMAGKLDGFQNTKAYSWLREHAHKYGFTMSYPPNNSFYIYEPWHWRFVGLELAGKLKSENKYFYDLEQREINGYLRNFFNATTTAQ
jgi:LAS superfamily LD-carboxypeptidase LdcB